METDPTPTQSQIPTQSQQQQQSMGSQMFPNNSNSASSVFGPINQPIPLPPPPIQQQQNQIYQQQQQQQQINRQQQQPEIDIDSDLLQQFSCLGTTDHDDLINQLQNIMNNQVNKETARFFLEMSNWNLQTAVCCYLDFFQLQTLPSMKIIEQSRPSELSQCWKLQNDGNESWPNGCYLLSPNQTKRIEVPAIRSGETCDIVADIPISSPPIMWRLCTPNGWYFGETIWMIPSGAGDTAADLAQRMSQLRTTTPTTTMSPESFPQVNVVILVKMD